MDKANSRVDKQIMTINKLFWAEQIIKKKSVEPSPFIFYCLSAKKSQLCCYTGNIYGKNEWGIISWCRRRSERGRNCNAIEKDLHNKVLWNHCYDKFLLTPLGDVSSTIISINCLSETRHSTFQLVS